MQFSSCFNVMKRYRIEFIRNKDAKNFTIYLSADCKGNAYLKALSFLYEAYGRYNYFLVSILEV
nr:MAG TPA: hypothetical protein [Caudoviricetes sp.]